MPQLIEVEHPSGNTIVFNNKKHVYYIKETGQKLVSVTTFISKFFPHFDFKKVSRKYAEKHGLNRKHVRADWDLKRKIGVNRGNYCHGYAEEIIKKGKSEKKRIPQLDFVDIAISELINKYQILLSEFIIASIELGIAGTVDIIGIDHPTILGIQDWKFNKNITKYSRWYAKPPIQYLTDTSYSKYLLQLNLYRHIIELEYKDMLVNPYMNKPKQSEMMIIHITETELNKYLVPYFDINILLNKKK